jgi:hypothetical protein
MTTSVCSQEDKLITAEIEIKRLRDALSDAVIVFDLGGSHSTRWWATYSDVIRRAMESREPLQPDMLEKVA